MATNNISRTRRALKSREEVESLHVDGDTTGAIFRAIVDNDRADDLGEFVESELDVDITKTTWVGFGVEVTIE